MSMREYPGSGYVVPLTALQNLLSPQGQEELQEALDTGRGDDAIQECLAKYLPKGLPDFSVYEPTETDTVDDPMQHGGVYVLFEEDELFVRVKTPEHEALVKLGVTPQFTHWSVWG